MDKKYSSGLTHNWVFSQEGALSTVTSTFYTAAYVSSCVLHQGILDPYSNQKIQIYEPDTTSDNATRPWSSRTDSCWKNYRSWIYLSSQVQLHPGNRYLHSWVSSNPPPYLSPLFTYSSKSHLTLKWRTGDLHDTICKSSPVWFRSFLSVALTIWYLISRHSRKQNLYFRGPYNQKTDTLAR